MEEEDDDVVLLPGGQSQADVRRRGDLSDPFCAMWANLQEGYPQGDAARVQERVRIDPITGHVFTPRLETSALASQQLLKKLQAARAETELLRRTKQELRREEAAVDVLLARFQRRQEDLWSAPNIDAEIDQEGMYEARDASGDWWPCVLTENLGRGTFVVRVGDGTVKMHRHNLRRTRTEVVKKERERD
eukprot:TRINITY_DN14130_c0_g1_i2.p1 TRINITY_DN14130_c0_g1~~TRINITY_DN14130_c0_g1_i2.p1  ORF type:complete len:208 (+),score=61.01 TRINITY_DN14130_c0_g1_i2:56-625(+)